MLLDPRTRRLHFFRDRRPATLSRKSHTQDDGDYSQRDLDPTISFCHDSYSWDSWSMENQSHVPLSGRRHGGPEDCRKSGPAYRRPLNEMAAAIY
jgi:hypothetical protein